MNTASDAIITTATTATTPDVAVIAVQNPDSNQNAEINQAIARRGGLWSQPGVPHTGWEWVQDEDIGEPSELCEMCTHQFVRYIQIMRHPDYPRELRVGRVCSGHMEGNLAAAHAREKKMISRAGKQKRWAARVWKILDNGNLFTKVRGSRITVFPRDNAWRCAVAPRYGTGVHFVPQTFVSSRQAQLAAFDFIAPRGA